MKNGPLSMDCEKVFKSNFRILFYVVDIIGSLSPGERNGNPLQYSCLEDPMDRGAWWAIVDGATKRKTQLKTLQFNSVHSVMSDSATP
ncbi:hypothetical protein CapIbe_001024 [Capra ibex]